VQCSTERTMATSGEPDVPVPASSGFHHEHHNHPDHDHRHRAGRATLHDVIDATERLRKEATREFYSKLRNERERATFSMMMRMNPAALTAIRKEFFLREDAVKVDEFIYISNKHLMKHPKSKGNKFVIETQEQREFVSNMYELFKDIDINGDGDLEWQEFTTFTVEKANLLNKRQKLASIAHYHDTTDGLDPSAHVRHRHDVCNFTNAEQLGQFALVVRVSA
jgi:hypothetical protein